LCAFGGLHSDSGSGVSRNAILGLYAAFSPLWLVSITLSAPPAAPVDGARVLTAERHHVAPPAVRILGVEVRQRLPAATETDDLLL